MNKLTKKILSAGMAVMMIVSAIVVPAYAESGFDGWNLYLSNKSKGAWELDDTVFCSGTSSLKITNDSPITANVFTRAITRVNMTKGKKYDISMKIKSEYAQNAIFLPENWVKRYSLTSYGSEYDWKKFGFTYIASVTGSVEMSFLLEGYGKIWIDEVRVIDRETGENILANGDFDKEKITQEEPDDTETIVEALDDSVVERYNKICNSDSFSQEAIESVRGAFKYMPVYPAKDIKIDASGDDWEDYPAMGLPTLPTQYTIFVNGCIKDIDVKAKFAQDDEAFYLYIEVTDDVYVYETNETYWIGDSVQLTISDLDEVYGSELGLTFNPDTEEGEVWGIGFSPEQRKEITFKGSRRDNKTYYEAKIPWKIKYSEKPKEFLFDFLVCDNDGQGRKYVLELAPGIAVGKLNNDFPLMEVVSEDSRDWYGWVECPGTGIQGEDVKFQYFLVNGGEEKTFTMTDSITGKKETVKIPAKSGIRREIVMQYDEVGEKRLSVDFESGGERFTSSDSCTIEKKPADAEFAYALSDKLKKHAEEIKSLIDQCESKGMNPMYEKIDYHILKKFSGYVIQDLEEYEELYRMNYTEETTDKIYEEAKANLEAYLSGEKEPASVPRYVQSDVKIDGQSMYALTETDGKIEERPVFFVGYVIHTAPEKEDLNIFPDLGLNTTAEELGPSMVMSNGNKWNFNNHNGASATYVISDEAPEEGVRSLLIKYDSPVTPNQFYSVSQDIAVEPGKTYVFKGKVKAENATNFAVTANNYDNRIGFNGTFDWKDFYGEYTAPEGKTSTTVRLMVDGPADGVYFSELSLKEKGAENAPELIVDGSFTNYGNADALVFNYESNDMKAVIESLERAEKNNIAVTFLLSPHFFFNDIIKQYGLEHPLAGSFTRINVSHPMVRKIYERFLRTVVPLIKDYKCITNIVVANEPQYDVSVVPEFYTVPWQEWLKEKYHNDISELNRVYKSNYSSFSEIELSRTDEEKAKTYDFMIFNDKVFGEWHKFMADIVHEYMPDMPVSVKIFGWTRTFSEPISMIRGTGLAEYDFINLNGCDYNNFLDDGVEGLGKLFWYDYMSSFRNLPVVDSEDHIVKDWDQNFYPLYLADYAGQVIYQGAVHGRAVTDTWIWSRHKANTAVRDSFLYRPDALKKISYAANDLNRLAYEITSLVQEPVEVGIVASKADWLFNIKGPRATYEAYEASLYLGQKPRFIVETLPEDINKYKAVIVPDTVYIPDNMVEALKDYIDNGGYVIIMGRDVLTKDEHDLDRDSEIVDYIINHSHVIEYDGTANKMTNMTKSEFLAKVYENFVNAGASYLRIEDAETGDFVPYLECNVGVNDGKVIINLANYEDNEKTVRVYLNGKQIHEATELRNREVLKDTFTIGSYGVITLEVNADNHLLDTFGHWAEDDIVKLCNKGIISGMSPSRYAPQNSTTRAEFLTLLVKAAGLEDTMYNGEIPDVKSDDWYAASCASALKSGIINPGENFRPNDKITRVEMCKLLVNCYEKTKGEITINDNITFNDLDKITDIDTVKKAVSVNLMVGYDNGSFEPESTATRAESAAVIRRYIG